MVADGVWVFLLWFVVEGEKGVGDEVVEGRDGGR